MNKYTNVKLIVGAATSLITVIVVGYFIADYNNSKARREAFGSMCPETRKTRRKSSSLYRQAIGLGMYGNPKIVKLKESLDRLNADIRQCDELGY